MHNRNHVNGVRRAGLGISVALTAVALLSPGSARAQIPSIVKTGLGFLNTGGYFFSGNAGGSSALGTPKFYSAGGYFGRSRHFGDFALSGGVESINASDHFIPFTGGNEFNLLGPAVRVSYGAANSRVRPFATFGLFAGRVRSVNQGFDRTEFTPSGSIGVEVGLNRNFSVVGSYRISQQINGVNTDGFGISLKIF